MIQFGEVRTDAIVTGWLREFSSSATLLSYVMNNYWETNYRAGQKGLHEFRYSLAPHGRFDEASCERFALGVAHPLVTYPVNMRSDEVNVPFEIEATSTLVTSAKLARSREGYIVRLFNPSGQRDSVDIGARAEDSLVVSLIDFNERGTERLSGPLIMGPYEIVNLLIEKVEKRISNPEIH